MNKRQTTKNIKEINYCGEVKPYGKLVSSGESEGEAALAPVNIHWGKRLFPNKSGEGANGTTLPLLSPRQVWQPTIVPDLDNGSVDNSSVTPSPLTPGVILLLLTQTISGLPFTGWIITSSRGSCFPARGHISLSA